MKKFLAPLICALSLATSGGVAAIFSLQLTGTVNVFADKVLVEFRNYDNTFLWSSRIPVGGSVYYEGDVPTHPSSEDFDYVFVSWDKPTTNVIKDTVFHAQFENKPRECRVTFKNYNGKVLYKDTVVRGGTAVYIGSVPVREPDEGYSYKFTGWDQDLENILEDTEFTAQFEEISSDFAITFKNYDETTLYVDHVTKGENAIYRGIQPTRPSTKEYEYEFIGWDKSLENITGHFTTYAVYEEKEVKYEVNFYNYDQTLLYTDYVSQGGEATYRGPTPYREPEGRYQYKFSGWNHPIDNVKYNLDVIATYETEEREIYTKYYNYDDTLLYISSSRYGMPSIYDGVTPTRPDDEKYTYTFSGWDRDLSNMTEDMVTYAEYEKELRKFRCTFRNNNGEVLYETRVTWGETAVYFGATPVRVGDDIFSYEFIGWDNELQNITEDTEFIAQYRVYGGGGGSGLPVTTVVFHDYNGQIIEYAYCEDGEDAKFHGIVEESEYGDKTPNRGSYYQFVGWNKSIKNIPLNPFSPYHVYAQYIRSDGYLGVDFYNYAGNELVWEYFVYPGDSISYWGPDHEDYKPANGFKGWTESLDNITTPLTVFPIKVWG